jgi:redox-sensitive bicupin YhaK (pirin superfamily)
MAIVKEADVQVMSAGKAVTHSEYNKDPDKEEKFL